MGVQGLWSLLQPCARPVKLESLEGKRLAIDSSIWLYHFQMAMRDKEGRTLSNAHILGFLWRILKLLFYGIRPVFVFDGGAPVLKRQTLVKRRSQREGAKEDHKRTARKLFDAKMRAAALEHFTKSKNRGSPAKSQQQGGSGAASSAKDLGAQDTVYFDEPEGISAQGPSRESDWVDIDEPQPASPNKATSPEKAAIAKRVDWHKDDYELPALQQDLNKITSESSRAATAKGKGRRNDMRFASEGEIRALLSTIAPTDVDLDSEFFRSLPTELQYELVGDMRAASRGTSYKRLQEMLAAAPTAIDFSRAQVAGLKNRNELTQKALEVTEEIGDAHIKIPLRIAGSRNREYLLVRSKGPEGGFVLGVRDTGTSQEKAIDVDVEEDPELIPSDTETVASHRIGTDGAEPEMEDIPLDLDEAGSGGAPSSSQAEALAFAGIDVNDPEQRKRVAQQLLQQRLKEHHDEQRKQRRGGVADEAERLEEELVRARAARRQRASSSAGKGKGSGVLFRKDSGLTLAKSTTTGSGKPGDAIAISSDDDDDDDAAPIAGYDSGGENWGNYYETGELDIGRARGAPGSTSATPIEMEDVEDVAMDDVRIEEPDPADYSSFYADLPPAPSEAESDAGTAPEPQMEPVVLSSDAEDQSDFDEEEMDDVSIGEPVIDAASEHILSPSPPAKKPTPQPAVQEQAKGTRGGPALGWRLSDRQGEPERLDPRLLRKAPRRNDSDEEVEASEPAKRSPFSPLMQRSSAAAKASMSPAKDASPLRAYLHEQKEPMSKAADEEAPKESPAAPAKEFAEVDATSKSKVKAGSAAPVEAKARPPATALKASSSPVQKTSLLEDIDAIARDETDKVKDSPLTSTKSASDEHAALAAGVEIDSELPKLPSPERDTATSEPSKTPRPSAKEMPIPVTVTEATDSPAPSPSPSPLPSPAARATPQLDNIPAAADEAGAFDAQPLEMDEDDGDDGPAASPPRRAEEAGSERSATPISGWSASPSPERVVLGPDGFPMPTLEELEALEAQDEEEMARLEGDQEHFASFLSQAKSRGLHEMQQEVQAEVDKLRAETANTRRAEGDVTLQMAREIQAMLRLFGLPYITAPMEAEAQCAELVSRRLVDGIITDDSDVFLFGGTRVYKNMFNNNKIVECFLLSDLQRELGLDREKLVRLAFLLGSDYTDGLPGVGPVLAMEILSLFASPDGLIKFGDWWLKVQQGRDTPEDTRGKTMKRIKKALKDKVHLEPSWPQEDVVNAYYHATVDESDEPFQWGLPDLDSLRTFLNEYLLWPSSKTDQYLLPVIEAQNRRTRARGQQTTLDRNGFFDLTAGSGVYVGRQKPTFGSARLQQVVNGFREAEKRKRVAQEPGEADVEPEKAKGRNAKQKRGRAVAREEVESDEDDIEMLAPVEDDGEQDEDDGPEQLVSEELVGKEMGKRRPVVRREQQTEADRQAETVRNELDDAIEALEGARPGEKKKRAPAKAAGGTKRKAAGGAGKRGRGGKKAQTSGRASKRARKGGDDEEVADAASSESTLSSDDDDQEAGDTTQSSAAKSRSGGSARGRGRGREGTARGRGRGRGRGAGPSKPGSTSLSAARTMNLDDVGLLPPSRAEREGSSTSASVSRSVSPNKSNRTPHNPVQDAHRRRGITHSVSRETIRISSGSEDDGSG